MKTQPAPYSDHNNELVRLRHRLIEAEEILRMLDGHPRADYPVSLDKRIKAWLAAEPDTTARKD